MNASVGFSPVAAEPAGDAAPLEAAGDGGAGGGRCGRCRPGATRGHDEDEGPQGRRSASEMFGNCHLFSSVVVAIEARSVHTTERTARDVFISVDSPPLASDWMGHDPEQKPGSGAVEDAIKRTLGAGVGSAEPLCVAIAWTKVTP